MKSTIKIYAILLLAFFISLPFALLSQEGETKEKKVTIKTVKEVDGKKIVKDTTFTVTGDDDVKKIVKTFTMDIDGDADSSSMIEVMVDVDRDVEWTTDKKKKIILMSRNGDHDMDFYDEDDNVKVITIDEDGNKKVIVKAAPHHSGKKVMRFKSGDDEEVIFISPHGKHSKSYKWVGEDGEEYDFDFDFDMEAFEHDMAEMKAEMKEMQIHILDEEGQLHDELIELESLKELEELKELENMEVIVVPPPPPKARNAPRMYNNFHRSSHHGMKVTDEELRDAGIKNKPDRLELNEIDIEKEDGIIDLSFTLKEEGTPKVLVYNVYGDKVFSGKPDLMNNQYQLKIDLSKKQHGNYYLMIIQGNSSKTMRLRN
jgi:hypothetical protein